MNLFFAGVAFVGGALLLQRQRPQGKPVLDIPGVLLVSGSVFCLVYGFSNAAAHSWGTPSTYGFIAAGVVLLAAFAAWQGRAAHPLLPPRVVLDRNRGGLAGPARPAHRLRHGRGRPDHQLGASIGTSLLNTIFAGAVTSYLAGHLASARVIGRQALAGQAVAHGYDTAFWWTAGIFAAGAVIGGALLRNGPLIKKDAPPGHPQTATGQAEADPALPV